MVGTQGGGVHGGLSLHLNDLLMSGDDAFETEFVAKLRTYFQAPRQESLTFVGKRINWQKHGKHGCCLNGQQKAGCWHLPWCKHVYYLTTNRGGINMVRNPQVRCSM